MPISTTLMETGMKVLKSEQLKSKTKTPSTWCDNPKDPYSFFFFFSSFFYYPSSFFDIGRGPADIGTLTHGRWLRHWYHILTYNKSQYT